MNKQEFLQRLDTHRRQSNKEAVVFIILIVLYFVLSVPILLYHDKHPATDSLLDLFWNIFTPVFWLSLLVATVMKTKRDLKKHGLLCPFCASQLIRAIVVTTGRCGHCGEQVLDAD